VIVNWGEFQFSVFPACSTKVTHLMSLWSNHLHHSKSLIAPSNLIFGTSFLHYSELLIQIRQTQKVKFKAWSTKWRPPVTDWLHLDDPSDHLTYVFAIDDCTINVVLVLLLFTVQNV